MYVADEAWPDLEGELDGTVALVPLGSTEQHGPHLPEGTDHLIAEAFARRAADRTGFLCTPTVNVGVSSHHRQFPGTMWVDPPAFRDYVESFTRNLTYHGVRKVVFVNAHGGNVEHLREVGRRLRDAEDAYAVEWMWNDSIPDLVDDAFEHNGPHGGPKETALIQYLHEDLVHDDRLEDAHEGGVESLADLDTVKHGARTFYDAIENSENGVFGDQTDATPEKGEALFDAALDELCQLTGWLDDQPFADLLPPERV
ncbi:creatininase family protein [Salarchaeum sp. III]|uniref:creatininase family protein n=1 Tax=Salarchaeum sp. III TaxID=3107927 RepID=UPI002EDBA69D